MVVALATIVASEICCEIIPPSNTWCRTVTAAQLIGYYAFRGQGHQGRLNLAQEHRITSNISRLHTHNQRLPLHEPRQVSHELAPFVKRRAPALGDPATSAGLHKGTLARTMRLVENTFSFTRGQDAETASRTGFMSNQTNPESLGAPVQVL